MLPPDVLQPENVGWFHVIFCVCACVCMTNLSLLFVFLVTEKTLSHYYKAKLHECLRLSVSIENDVALTSALSLLEWSCSGVKSVPRCPCLADWGEKQKS